MQITSYFDQTAFSELAPHWNALARRSATHTLFQTIEWLSTWWSALGEGALQVLALHEDGALVGIAPLFSPQPGELAVLGYKEVTDYVDVLFAAGFERACWTATLDHIASQEWTTFNLFNVPAASVTLAMVPELATACGWHALIRDEDVCPIIALTDTFESYLASLDGKERRELMRKLRRAEEDTLVKFTTHASTLKKDVDDFIHLMRQSTFAKSDFMNPRMVSYFHVQAQAMFDAGWLQLAFLEIEGERAATYMNFVYNNSVLVYNSGLDPAKFAHLSPGQVLIGKLIEHAIQNKCSTFDFLQGNEEYKFKLGAQATKVQTLTLTRI